MNISDPEQIERTNHKVEFLEKQRKEDMRILLAMPAFLRFVLWIFTECRINKSVWSQSAAIHKDAGRQEVAHAVALRIVETDPNTLSKLLTELYIRDIKGEMSWQ